MSAENEWIQMHVYNFVGSLKLALQYIMINELLNTEGFYRRNYLMVKVWCLMSIYTLISMKTLTDLKLISCLCSKVVTILIFGTSE